jgi:hypothetical protein
MNGFAPASCPGGPLSNFGISPIAVGPLRNSGDTILISIPGTHELGFVSPKLCPNDRLSGATKKKRTLIFVVSKEAIGYYVFQQ